MFAAAAATVAGAYAAYPNAGMYTGAVENTWTGADSENPTLWNTPENWSCNAVPVGGGDKYVHVEGYDDIAGTNGIRGVYAKFAGDSAITVTATNNAPASEAFATRGVVIASGCGAVTIRRAPHWGNSGITLGMNNGRPSFFNYSSSHAVFDIITRFGGLGYGNTGILPGAEFLREFYYTGSVDDFCFYAGDPERTDYENTTILKADAKFGSHKVFVQTNHIVEVQGSISSTSSVTVTGSLRLNGATVSVGSLATADGGEIRLSGANTFTTTTRMSVGNLTLDDGAQILLAGGEISFAQKFEAEEIAVSDTVTLGSWPVAEGARLRILPPDSFAPGARHTALYVPASVKTVTAEDFEVALQNIFAVDSIVSVEPSESGLQKVTISIQDDYAYLTTNQREKGSGSWSDSDVWTNSTGVVVPLATGSKFVVDGHGSQFWVRTPGDRELTFPGDALIVQGGKADSAEPFQKAALGLKGQTIEVGDLRLGESGGIGFLSYDNEQSAGQTLTGGIYVAGETAAKPAYIFGSGNYTNRINAAISGSGQLRITPYDKKCTTFDLNGDNSDYTGEMRLDFYPTTDYYPTIRVTSANALGGNPSSQNLNALRLNASRLEILDDVSMTAENRVLNVMRSSQLYVADGKTFTIASPLYFDSSTTDSNLLRKLGGGDFVLTAQALSAGTIKVEEGRVVAADPYAAAGIEIDSESEGEAILPSLADAVTVEETAARRFEAKDWLFVPNGSIESAATDNLARVTTRGWKIPANYGTPGKWRTTLGQYAVEGGVMLTVTGKISGMTLIIR